MALDLMKAQRICLFNVCLVYITTTKPGGGGGGGMIVRLREQRLEKNWLIQGVAVTKKKKKKTRS